MEADTKRPRATYHVCLISDLTWSRDLFAESSETLPWLAGLVRSMEHHLSDLRMSMENRGFEPRLPLGTRERLPTDYSKRAFDRIRGSLGSITWIAA